MKIVVMYDCPLNSCDKLWLHNGLEKKGYKVKVIDSKYTLSRLSRNGFWGNIISKIYMLKQGIIASLIANKEDIILCWTTGLGVNTYLATKILFRNRKIISLNWLTPTQKGINKILFKRALMNKNFISTVNDNITKDKILKYYSIDKGANIFYFQDIFDDSEKFINSKKKKEKRYCFTGGMNNRYWESIIEVAKINSDINFKFVSLKKIGMKIGLYQIM